MTDLHIPVTAIATAWFKAILKPTYLVAVDDGAHAEHDIFIRSSEVEIGGEPPIISEPTLSQARPTFERKAAVIEDANFGE